MINRLRKSAAMPLLVPVLLAGVLIAGLYADHILTSDMPAAGEPQASPAPLEPPAPNVPETPKPLSNRIVEYHISVDLDAQNKTLSGAQSLTWKNPGSVSVSELYFHLYPNAFESKKTTFIRESGGRLRQDEMAPGSFGGITIDSIRTSEGTDLLHTMQYIQPDDGNKQDRTLMKIRLPEPVEPGKTVTLRFQFTVKLPQVFARMGYAGDFVMAGQWFPKVAVYEPRGVRGRADEGWNLHQYHGNSEFYANFGIYNVRIRVPAGYTVAATGFPVKPAADDGTTKTYHFYAEDVHDFGWAASPHFLYEEEPFSAPGVPGVKIKLYLDPEHKELKERYFYAAKRALAKYSEWFGSYPYSTLSIVVPPSGGNGAGGMEYPTLITSWDASQKTDGFGLERVLVHEIGHQYWYGMVANNEFEEAWLDEAFTSYAEDLVMSSEFGVKSNFPLESSYITSPASLHQYAWHYGSHGEYAENVYIRGKLVLAAIEKQIGQKQMLSVLKTYFNRWKFKHPSTKDFQAVLEEVTKSDWSEFFDQFVYGGLMTDYAVEPIQIRKLRQDDKTVYENRVLVRKYGGHYAEVPILFHFADGSSLNKTWDGKDAEALFSITSESPVDWVAIDPQHTIVLENRKINNFWKAEVDEKWIVRWNLGSAQLIETLLGLIAW